MVVGTVAWEGAVFWSAFSLLFALLQEASEETVGQRENLLSSKLAAGGRVMLKVAGMCQASLKWGVEQSLAPWD